MSSLTAQQLHHLISVTEELVFVSVWELAHRRSDDDEEDKRLRSVGHTGLASYLSADVFGISRTRARRARTRARRALRARVLEKKAALVRKGMVSVEGASLRLVLEAANQMSEAKATQDPFDWRGQAGGRKKGKTGRRVRDSEQEYVGGSRGKRTTTGAIGGEKWKKAKKRKLGTSLVSPTVTRASPSSDKPSNAPFNDTLSDSLSLMPAPSSRKARRVSSVGYGPYDPIMPFSLPRPRSKPAHSLPSSTPSSPSLSGGTKPRRSHESCESSTPTIAALGGSVIAQKAEEEREQAVEEKKTNFDERLAGLAVRKAQNGEEKWAEGDHDAHLTG